MYDEITTQDGLKEMYVFSKRCTKMMDDLIESRDEAFQALQKLGDWGWHDAIVVDFEEQFVEVAKKIEYLEDLMEMNTKYYKELEEIIKHYEVVDLRFDK